jgi:hypothetical protein
MNRVSRNDDPPEQHEALEIKVRGEQFAWDDSNRVYRYGGPGEVTEREDGYVFIGELIPRDEPEYDPVRHLREFAEQYLLEQGASSFSPTTGAHERVGGSPRP